MGFSGIRIGVWISVRSAAHLISSRTVSLALFICLFIYLFIYLFIHLVFDTLLHDVMQKQ